MEEKDQVTTTGASDSPMTKDEIDTIGEILNISMGSAATAMSALLDRQVVITPPKVTLQILSTLDYADLEPSVLVRIEYIEGLTGSNVMVFRQHDMQVILNLLMGTDDPPRDDFVFDELSMSAACEVMNQMMGASATALSEVLGKAVNISTPNAFVVKDETVMDFVDVPGDENVIAISFGMTIKDVMATSFASIMPCDLAQMLIKQVIGDQANAMEGIAPPSPAAAAPIPAPPAPAPAAPMPAPVAPAPAAPMPAAAPVAPMPAAAPPPIPGQPPEAMQQPPAMPMQPQMGAVPPGYGMPMQQYPPAGYPPYYYPPVPPMPQGDAGSYTEMGVIKQPINIQNAQFPSFSGQAPAQAYPPPGGSMDLIMNVSLGVSVEIGKTKRKIREIMEFGQGTVIELEKQAGAPVDIVVNGQLIARGDVVVIDDNFGVRVTEVLGTKDLMDSLNEGK